jgi:hypothetical protein
MTKTKYLGRPNLEIVLKAGKEGLEEESVT